MKVATALILSILLTLSLVGCGGDNSVESRESVVTSEPSSNTGSQSGNAEIPQSDQNNDFTHNTQEPEPETQTSVEWYDEFLAYVSELDYPRTFGVTDDNIAYWIENIDKAPDATVLFDLNTKEVCQITKDIYNSNRGNPKEGKVVTDITHYYKNSFYGTRLIYGEYNEYAYDFPTSTTIGRYDTHGNFMQEYFTPDSEYLFGGGWGYEIFVTADEGIHIIRNYPFNHYIMLSDNESYITIDSPPITVDIGHGKTVDVPSYAYAKYNGKLYIQAEYDGSRYHCTYDSTTGALEELNFDPPYTVGNFNPTFDLYGQYGKYIISNDKVFNIETGEVIAEVYTYDLHFTDTTFYRSVGEVLYKVTPVAKTGYEDRSFEQPEAVLEMPNNSDFTVLNDEYVVVKDKTGTYLYRIIEGNTAGEFIAEINRSDWYVPLYGDDGIEIEPSSR